VTTSLATLVLAALAALPRPPGGTRESRAEAVDAIVAAANERPLFERAAGSDGTAEIAATALVLAAVAQHESSFDPRVGSCVVHGGGAISYFQLLGAYSLGGHTKAEVCASPSLAAKLALRVLHLQKRRCKQCDLSGWLAGYASGSPSRPSRTSRETEKLVVALARHASLRPPTPPGAAPSWAR